MVVDLLTSHWAPRQVSPLPLCRMTIDLAEGARILRAQPHPFLEDGAGLYRYVADALLW